MTPFTGWAIFDLGLGDVLSVRAAGNITTEEVIGSIEFAAIVAGANGRGCWAHKVRCDRVSCHELLLS